MSKMSLTPPKKRTPEEFIQGANEYPQSAEDRQAETSYPWENEKVREDVIKSFNLRLPEPYILKLQYLSTVTHKSQQAIIKEILLPELDEQIAEITK
jgi:hypothetical protein